MSVELWTAWATAVTAFATIIYTVGSLILWRLTQRSLQLTEHQLELQNAATKTQSLHNVINSHRELYTLLLQPQYIALFDDDPQRDERAKASDIIATMMINHCLSLFIDLKAGVIESSQWNGFLRDARDLFHVGLIRDRWRTVQEYYPPEFRRFVVTGVLENSAAERVAEQGTPRP